MSAFASLLLFIFVALLSMCVVAYSNYRVEQNKKIRVKIQHHKARIEQLEDIVLVLDRLCDNRMITTLINDDVIEIYEEMIELSPKTLYIKAGHTNAKMRSSVLSDDSHPKQIDRICTSDAQIARCRAYIQETSTILRRQNSEGKFSATELQEFINELNWLHLQVYVITNIAEGHKAYSRNDILKANGFYKKAQTELLGSGHPDERRHKMITQVADILFGRRRFLDKDLMPEDEFNPADASITEDKNGEDGEGVSSENMHHTQNNNTANNTIQQ